MMKHVLKRALSFALAVIMVFSLFPALETHVHAAGTLTLTDANIGLSWTDASNSKGSASWTADDGLTIIGTAQGYTQYVVSKKSVTTKLTITNNYNEDRTLSFSWNLNGGGSVSGIISTTSGEYSETLIAGSSATITLTSPTGSGNTNTLTITGMQLLSDSDVTSTFMAPENGSYTVDGTSIAVETEMSKAATEAYSLAATPAANYMFFGWWSETSGSYVSHENPASVNFSADPQLKPVFVTKGTALFGVGAQRFYDLTEASTYAQNVSTKTVVLLNNGTVKGEHTIHAGVTLLVPFNDANTLYTNKPGCTSSALNNVAWVKPTAYRTLTMAEGAKITVNGAISLSAQHAAANGGKNYSGSPTGPVSFLNMKTGSNITLNSGAKLYAWGFITGSGSVTANSGSAVYENFQVADFRGGNATMSYAGNGLAFPLNQYYVQNIEVPVTFKAGAEEYIYTSAYASLQCLGGEAKFIGSGGMFNSSGDSYVVKDYIENRDRLQVDMYGDCALNSMTVNFSIEVDSSTYILPITNNVSINIHTGTTTLNQSVALLPGAEVSIDEGATLSLAYTDAAINDYCAAGYNIVAYDSDEWFYGISLAEDDTFGDVTEGTLYGNHANGFTPVVYAPGQTYTRTKANDIKDAIIDVNGTIESNGFLYTTIGGAAIKSSGKTGTIKMINGAGADMITCQNNGTTSTTLGLMIRSAWLQNGDGSYVETMSFDDETGDVTFAAEPGTIYNYCATHDKWYTGQCEDCANHEHSYDTEVAGTRVDATCMAEGTVTMKCDCGATEDQTLPIDKTNHTKQNTTVQGAFDATCGAEGYTGDTYCECGEKIASGETIPATGEHTFTMGILSNSEYKAATCEGNAQYWLKCDNCEAISNQYYALKPNSALGHDYTDAAVSYEWNDDHSECIATRYCNRDASHTETAKATISESSVEANCQTAGSVTYTATFNVDWAETKTETVYGEIAPTVHTSEELVYTPNADNHTHKVTHKCCGAVVAETEDHVYVVHDSICDKCGAGRIVEITWAGYGTEEYAYGATPAYKGTEPSKSSPYTCTTYEFAGWSATDGGAILETIPAVTVEAVYYPVFTKVENHNYEPGTYTWSADNKECSVVGTCSAGCGTTATATAAATAEVTTEANCQTAQVITYTATFAETWAAEQTKAVTGSKDMSIHTNLVADPAQAPTCEVDGLTEGQHCTACGSITIAQQTDPAIGHAWTVKYNFASDGSSCTATRTCANDETHIESTTATITSAVKTPATCEEMGTTTYTATFPVEWAETQTLDVVDIPEKNHAWSVTYDFAEDGSSCTATRVCGNDAAHNVTATATITSAVSTPATCEEMGTTTYTATFTETWAETQTLDVVDIPKKNHAWSVTYDFAEDGSSCTATRICGNDAAHNVTATAAITSAEKIAATCTVMGTTTYTATFDVEWATTQYKDVQDIKVIPHTPKEPVEENRKDPVHPNAGSYESVVYCDVCNYEISRDTVVIPASEHTPGNAVIENNVDPTCTEPGSYDSVVYCTDENCKAQISRETITVDALGHTWGETEYQWTGYSACIATHTCENDANHKETATATITYEVTTEPTCTEGGVKTYTATFNVDWASAQTKQEDVTELGHSFDPETHECKNPNCDEVEKFTITWIVDGVETKTEYAFGAKVSPPEAPDGWHYHWNTIIDGNTVYEEFYNYAMPDNDITYTAIVSLYVTLKYGNGVDDASYIVSSGVEHGAYDCDKSVEGYNFVGWTTDENGSEVVYPVGQNVAFTAPTTLYGVWEKINYNITWNINGNVTTSTVAYGETPVAPVVSDYVDGKLTYTFKKWDKEITPAYSDATYTATFTKTGFTIAEGSNELVYLRDNEVLKSGWTEIGGNWYYLDPDSGYVATGAKRVPYPTEAIYGVYYGPNEADLVNADKYGYTDAEDSYFIFDEDGVFQYNQNGVYYADLDETEGNEMHWAVNGQLPWHVGLVKDGNDYYYFVGANKMAIGDVYVHRNTTELSVTIGGVYTFGADGKLCDYDGITDVDGTLKYYVNSQLMCGAGLVKVDNNYIYVRTSGELVVNGSYWVAANDLGIAEGSYEFDENGFMVQPKLTSKDGIYQEDGNLYYYVDGNKTYGGLIHYTLGTLNGEENELYDDVWVYVRSNGQLVVGQKYWVTKTEDAAHPAGYYLFNEYGILVDMKNGVYAEDGGLFYYEDNVRTYAGLIYYTDGATYKNALIYVKSNGQLATGEYYITKANTDKTSFAAGKYEFDENGIMMSVKDGIVEENGVLYYYENNVIQYGAGLIDVDGKYIYVRSNGQLATGQYWVTNTNDTGVVQGMYEFGADGYMIIATSDGSGDLLDGIVSEEGALCYYVDGVKQYGLGLIEYNDGYIYVKSNGELATGEYYVTNHNGLEYSGKRTFDDDGMLII